MNEQLYVEKRSSFWGSPWAVLLLMMAGSLIGNLLSYAVKPRQDIVVVCPSGIIKEALKP